MAKESDCNPTQQPRNEVRQGSTGGYEDVASTAIEVYGRKGICVTSGQQAGAAMTCCLMEKVCDHKSYDRNRDDRGKVSGAWFAVRRDGSLSHMPRCFRWILAGVKYS